MGYTLDARGKPTANDAADPVADLQAGYDWADKVGAGIRGTSNERTNLTAAQLEIGQTFVETDTGNMYVLTNTGLRYIGGADTGWTPCTAYDGNWSVAALGGYSALSVRRFGKEVHLHGVMRWLASASTSPGFQGAKVPEGFRPPTREPISAFAGEPIEVSVATNGDIALGVGTHKAGPRDFVLTAKWTVD